MVADRAVGSAKAKVKRALTTGVWPRQSYSWAPKSRELALFQGVEGVGGIGESSGVLVPGLGSCAPLDVLCCEISGSVTVYLAELLEALVVSPILGTDKGLWCGEGNTIHGSLGMVWLTPVSA